MAGHEAWAAEVPASVLNILVIRAYKLCWHISCRYHRYEAWSAKVAYDGLEASVVGRAHLYCAPHPTNPSVPLEGQSDAGDNAEHWCDLELYSMHAERETHTQTHTDTHRHTHARMCAHTQKHRQTHARIRACTYVRTCMHACMHVYIRTYVHACIHACIHTSSLFIFTYVPMPHPTSPRR